MKQNPSPYEYQVACPIFISGETHAVRHAATHDHFYGKWNRRCPVEKLSHSKMRVLSVWLVPVSAIFWRKQDASDECFMKSRCWIFYTGADFQKV
jgi:hypothetical protein